MPILTKHQIVRITDVMLQAGGALADHAGIVADHLANANLTGYDSHGYIRIPQYMKNIEDGELDPKAEPEVVGNHGGIFQIDGHATFGQVVATRATELAGDMRSRSWSRFSGHFLARSLCLQERWNCGQDPRYSSSTWAVWRPWKPSGPRSNR